MIDLSNSDNLLIIRTQINKLRRYKGIKLKQITEQLGVSESYFNEIWHGSRKMYPEQLCRIADILDTTPEYLCGLTINPDKSKTVAYNNEDKLQVIVDRLKSMDNDKLDKVLKMLDIIE